MTQVTEYRPSLYGRRLPVPMETAWPAVATVEGLEAWLDRGGGAGTPVRRRRRAAGPGEGQVTAWDVDRVAEYTLARGDRVRFHLERDGGTAGRRDGGTVRPGPPSSSRDSGEDAPAFAPGRDRLPWSELRALSERASATVADGTVSLPVTAEFGLEEAAEAHRLMGVRTSTGELLLRVGG